MLVCFVRVSLRLQILDGQCIHLTVGGPCVAHWITSHRRWVCETAIAVKRQFKGLLHIICLFYSVQSNHIIDMVG